MEKLRVLDLFSGIGGFSLGLERTGCFRTVAFCEIEPFPRKVLAKHWPDVPIFEDVRKLHAEDLPEPVDIICGGYPCQPFSLAGKRKGAEDDRHLWPEMFRLVQEIRPYWVLAENVAGHVNMGLDQVLSDLESEGYETTAFIIPACGVDAQHRRDRVWIVSNDGKQRAQRLSKDDKDKRSWEITGTEPCRCGEDVSYPGHQLPQIWATWEWNGRRGDVEQPGGVVADTISEQPTWRMHRIKRWERCASETERHGRQGGTTENVWWPTEPNVGRVAYGVPFRVDRLKALGNAVVPQVVEVIGRAILESEEQHEISE